MKMVFMLIRVWLPLAIIVFCLFGKVFDIHCDIIREFQVALLSTDWVLLVCLAVWFGAFVSLTFSLNDLPLIALLLIAMVAFFIEKSEPFRVLDALVFCAAVTLGKGSEALWISNSGLRIVKCESISNGECRFDSKKSYHQLQCLLFSLILLLVFASWWHLDMSANYYHGPRWTGLWYNPNIYGMLMGVGIVLSAGLLANVLRKKVDLDAGLETSKWRSHKLQAIILFIAAGMM